LLIYSWVSILVIPASPALVQATRELQRRVYTSMSWGYRLAAVLYQVKFASDPEAFGRLALGVFLMLGVTGMPRAPLIPSASREIDRLPRGYGHDCGLASRALARRFFTDEGEGDDLLAVVGLKVLSEASLHRGLVRLVAERRAREPAYEVLRNGAARIR
jgi:hypothetical protein